MITDSVLMNSQKVKRSRRENPEKRDILIARGNEKHEALRRYWT